MIQGSFILEYDSPCKVPCVLGSQRNDLGVCLHLYAYWIVQLFGEYYMPYKKRGMGSFDQVVEMTEELWLVWSWMISPNESWGFP